MAMLTIDANGLGIPTIYIRIGSYYMWYDLDRTAVPGTSFSHLLNNTIGS
eukprot:COSAG05_NODE_1680_length_4291_cov_2.546040_2_plen_50_part_00